MVPIRDIPTAGRHRIDFSYGYMRGGIIDGKVWIQHDGTNRPVAEALLDEGIPREDIVLAFHPARLRHLTGFAVN